MVYIVLGMHKSGTTLVARLLQEAGIQMVDYPGGGRYQDDKYEREATKAINKALLADENQFSLDVTEPLIGPLDPALLARARQQARELSDLPGDWGFKDPRTCLTLPFWDEALAGSRAVFVHRHPMEVMANYLRSRKRYKRGQRLRLAVAALNAWHVYNRSVLRHLERSIHPDRRILVDYTRLMQRPAEEIARLEHFLGRALDAGALVPNRFRSTRELRALYAAACTALALRAKPTWFIHRKLVRMAGGD